MASRQREWARRKTAELRATLGNKCAQCGATVDLEFDCIKPQGDRHHKIEWSHRISFYRTQHAEGNLQILCSPCNSAKSINERELVECPF